MGSCCGARRDTLGQWIILAAVRLAAGKREMLVKDVSEMRVPLSVEQLSLLFLWYKLKLRFAALTCIEAKQSAGRELWIKCSDQSYCKSSKLSQKATLVQAPEGKQECISSVVCLCWTRGFVHVLQTHRGISTNRELQSLFPKCGAGGIELQ